MAVANSLELSQYILAMAASARGAQALMSVQSDPMTIKEFNFKVNISADLNINSETSVGLNIWRLSIKEKLTIDYKTHWGLEVNCTIVPTFLTA